VPQARAKFHARLENGNRSTVLNYANHTASACTVSRTDVWFSVERHRRLLVLVLSVVLLYAPVIAGLLRQWYKDPNYSHGFIVPIFSGYLAWKKRDLLAAIDCRPNISGILVVLGALALLILGSLGAELFLTRISLPVTIVGLIVYFCGWPCVRALAFPLAFLTLMVPLPALVYNQVVFPLQLLASGLATTCLRTTAIIPVLREGNLIILPGYTLEVVEACSGIRSLISLTALALAYGYMAESRRWHRFFLVLSIVPIAIVSNSFRIVLSALLAEVWGAKAAEGGLHAFSGWVIFLVATILLLAVHRLLNLTERHGGAGVQA